MRAIIFANGNFEKNSDFSIVQNYDVIIAANGGVRHCLTLNLTPDFIIGDLDSIKPQEKNELQAKGVRLVTYPRNKDQTDLELALRFAISQGIREIHLLGLMGNRMDQTLANFLLLAREDWSGVRLTVSEGPDFAYLLRSGESLTILGNPGDLISLIPLSSTVEGITTNNLRWQLTHATIEFGSTLGVSNEMTQSTANVAILAGRLFVIHRKNYQP